MTKVENRARKVAQKIQEAMNSLPEAEEMKPMIIAELLRGYERYGLADLVQMGWEWKPREGDRIESTFS